jgi:hypothetical protein
MVALEAVAFMTQETIQPEARQQSIREVMVERLLAFLVRQEVLVVVALVR